MGIKMNITIEEKIAKILDTITGTVVTDYNSNLFGMKYRISPPDMVFFVLALEQEFGFVITDEFIEKIHCASIHNIAVAITTMQSASLY